MNKAKGRSHWNYRALKRTYEMPGGGVEEQVEIVEAHYTDDKLEGWTANAVNVASGEGRKGVEWILSEMAKALDKPLIIVKNVGNNEHLVEEQENW